MSRKLPAIIGAFLCLLAAPRIVLMQTPSEARLLTLEECWNRVRADHPLVLAAQSRVEGADEFRRYAGVRPNPTVTLQTENWRAWQRPPFTFPTDIDLFLYGTQRWERGGKAERRRELADRVLATVQNEVDLTRHRLWQEITRRYWEALQVQGLLEISQENRRDLDQLVQFTTARYQEGFVAEWEVIRVQLEQQTLLNQQSIQEQELEKAKLDLLRAVGEKTFQTDFRLAEPALLDSPLLQRTVAELQSEALRQRVELAHLRARVETERANLKLQEANAKPDWEFSAGYKRTGGFNTMLAYVTIPLPFFNRNRGEIGRAAAEIGSAEQELMAQTNYIQAEVEAGYRAVHQLEGRLKEMQRDFLARADESRAIALTAYREGAADLYKLLEAQRARNEARRLFYRTKLDLQMALAELALAVGRRELR